MKILYSIFFAVFVSGLAIWLITRPSFPQNPLMVPLTFAIFAITPAGACWMLYMVIRYEKNPIPLILMAVFVPFAFVWYYLEHVKPGKLQPGATGSRSGFER